jgi:hypothetical protein
MTDINISDENIEFDKKNLETMEMFSEIINETNKKVMESWKSAQHNKARDIESAKVINEVEQTPEEALAS